MTFDNEFDDQTIPAGLTPADRMLWLALCEGINALGAFRRGGPFGDRDIVCIPTTLRDGIPADAAVAVIAIDHGARGLLPVGILMHPAMMNVPDGMEKGSEL